MAQITDAVRQYNTQYYINNKQRCINNAKAWDAAHPDRVFRRRKAKGANRTAKELGIPGRLVIADIDRLVEANPMSCHYCGVAFSHNEWQIDHVVPMKHGGANSLDNLVICCKGCNEVKHWKTKEAFLTKKGN